MFVGVATISRNDLGRHGPHAHVLRVVELPFVLDVGHTEVPEGLFQDHAEVPRGHRVHGFRGVARVDAPPNHDGHGVHIVIHTSFALPGRLAACAGLVGPKGRCHPERRFGMGRRVLRGGGRQVALLDELPDQSVLFGPFRQELAQSPVLAPQIALRALRGEVRPGSQVQLQLLRLPHLQIL